MHFIVNQICRSASTVKKERRANLTVACHPQRSNECACLSHARAIECAWEWIAPFLQKQASAKMAADLNFAVCVLFREDKAKTKQLRGVSFIYLFQQRNYLCNNSEFSCRIYEFVAKHDDLCLYRDSCRWSPWGQIFGSERLLPMQ